MHRALCCLGARLSVFGVLRGVSTVFMGRACRAGIAAPQKNGLFGAASRRLLSGGGGRGGGGTGGRGGSDLHKNEKRIDNKHIAKHLNAQILSSDTETLCDIIKTRAADFNHVNVATALRKALEAPRHRVPRDIMGILEESAFRNMQDFDSRSIANSLHTMAKKKYRPQDRLLTAIEQRAEAISGDFNP